MIVDPSALPAVDAYRLMISCVIPRPIGWISTQDAQGATNLAPFSYFGGVTSSPMVVSLSVGRRRGERKDTARNLLDQREGVIHICGAELAEQMVQSSAELPPGESEFDFTGLTPIASETVAPPRVAEAKIAMEAKQIHHQEVGTGPVDLFLLEITRIHLAEDVLDADGRPDAAKLQAVGRLGGRLYCNTQSPYEIARPL